MSLPWKRIMTGVVMRSLPWNVMWPDLELSKLWWGSCGIGIMTDGDVISLWWNAVWHYHLLSKMWFVPQTSSFFHLRTDSSRTVCSKITLGVYLHYLRFSTGGSISLPWRHAVQSLWEISTWYSKESYASRPKRWRFISSRGSDSFWNVATSRHRKFLPPSYSVPPFIFTRLIRYLRSIPITENPDFLVKHFLDFLNGQYLGIWMTK